MGVTGDHLHEVEITVHGAQVVHRHRMVFIGVPGDVEIRHRSQPITFAYASEAESQIPPPPPPWQDYDTGEWGILGEGEPHDTPGGHDT